MIGETIGHYRVIRTLGGGGMGIVYEAEDLRLGRRVAVKVLAPRLAGSAQALARFEREARAVAALNHPHICTIHDIDRHEGAPFIVMELLDGEPLSDRLQGATLPLTDTLDVGAQVADALDTAHGAGIVHRDVKPANIFLTRRGGAKLLDFGVAKLAFDVHARQRSEAQTVAADTALTGLGTVVGTSGYLSPEQALGREADPRSDLFSLGVVLYEMATGRRPFTGDTPAVVNDAVVHVTPPPPAALNPRVPALLAGVIDKALEKDPALRYQSAKELTCDLRRAKRETLGQTPAPGEAGPTPPADGTTPGAAGSVERVERRARRRSRLRAAVAAAGVAVLFAGAWFGVSAYQNRLPRFESRQLTSDPGIQTEPAISPDNRTIAYVAPGEAGAPDIWMIDVDGGPPTNWTRSPAIDRHPAWAPDGRMVYFESERGGRRGIFRASHLSAANAVLVVPDAQAPAVSPDGTQLAFAIPRSAQGRMRIGMAPLPDGGPVEVLTGDADGGLDHGEPAWSPDGREICYWAWDGLWIVAAQGGPARQLTSSPASDLHPSWSRNGRFVYFSSWRNKLAQLWRVSRRGDSIAIVTPGLGHEHNPAVSQDGSLLAFSTGKEERKLVLRDLTTGREEMLGGAGDQMFPALSHDGRTLYYCLRAYNRLDIWAQALVGGTPRGAPRQLTSGSGQSSKATVSPDGSRVAYYFKPDAGTGQVWTVPASGADLPVDFSRHASRNGEPAWAPDGSRIAFSSDRDGGWHIYVQPVEHGKPAGPAARLTSGNRGEEAPAWSPDSRRIAFRSVGDDGSGEVGIAPVEGGATPEVVTKGANAWRVAWRADGRTLLVSAGWGTDALTISAYDPASRSRIESFPPIALGPGALSGTNAACFALSVDGRYLAYVRASPAEWIGILKATSGRF